MRVPALLRQRSIVASLGVVALCAVLGIGYAATLGRDARNNAAVSDAAAASDVPTPLRIGEPSAPSVADAALAAALPRVAGEPVREPLPVGVGALTLHATDERGAPLSSAVLLRVPTPPTAEARLHPGPRAGWESLARIENGATELERAWFANGELWLAASGRAMTRVLPPADAQASVRVALAPGGDLSIRFDAVAPADVLRLALTQRGSEPAIGRFDVGACAEVRFEGLPVGALRCELTRRVEAPVAFDEETVAIEAGVTRELRLELPPTPSLIATARVRGLVWIEPDDASALVRESAVLELHRYDLRGKRAAKAEQRIPLARMLSANEQASLWNFESELLPLGTYRAELHPLGQACEFSLRADGAVIEVVAPPLAHARVRFVDGAGRALVPRRLGASRNEAALPSGSLPLVAVPVPGARGVWEVSGSPGSVRILHGLADYHPREVTLELASGRAEIDVALTRAWNVSIAAVRAGAPVGVEPDQWLDAKVEPLTAGLSILERGATLPRAAGDPSTLALRVSGPGRIRVELREVDRVLAVRELEVAASAPRETLAIELD